MLFSNMEGDKMLRVSVLSDQGSSKHREDGFVVRHPFYAVADGMSANYCKEHPQQFYGKLSGGEMAARVFEETFFACPEWSLTECIRSANRLIGEKHVQAGLSLESPQDLAGCCFTVARFTGENVEIFQAGDAIALWLFQDSTIGFTPNQMQKHEMVTGAEFQRIFHQVAHALGVDLHTADHAEIEQVRNETWERYCVFSRQDRGQNANSLTSLNAYGVMNGSPKLSSMISRTLLARKSLKLLLLCTDGLIPWSTTKSILTPGLAHTLMHEYYHGGLNQLLVSARAIEAQKTRTSHVAGLTEVTAIAIEF